MRVWGMRGCVGLRAWLIHCAAQCGFVCRLISCVTDACLCTHTSRSQATLATRPMRAATRMRMSSGCVAVQALCVLCDTRCRYYAC
jgi:hypothetical protein